MRRTAPILAITALLALTIAACGTTAPPRALHGKPPHTEPITLDGLDTNPTVQAAVTARRAEIDETARRRWLDAQAMFRVREAAARRTPPAARSGSAVTGSCAAMKPPGFPDWIIQRESGGDPEARNPSGAYGCAQLMPGTGGSGTYAERWARTWAGGAGACHWQPPRYCAG